MLSTYNLKSSYLIDSTTKIKVMTQEAERTDKELVSLSLRNSEYFGELVDRYEAKLFRYIRRLSGLENESIEDVLQEAFIKVYTNLND